MRKKLEQLKKRGQGLVEYALILVLIAIVVILILTFLGLMFILESLILAVFVVPIAAVFYLFEVVIVVSIQAFIFAALSAIYIGSAIEPDH